MNHLKRTICDILLNQVKNSPTNNSIGTIKNNKVSFISFKKYLETIECLTIGLLNLGVKAQSKVCILSLTRKEWNFFDLAIMCSGAISVPIYPSYTADEVEFIVNHSDAEFLIIEDQEQLEKIINIQGKLTQLKKIISITHIPLDIIKKLNSKIEFLDYQEFYQIGLNESHKHPDQFTNLIENVFPENIATIVYTSGTTGEPKGAVIKHDALFQVLLNVKKYTHSSIHSNDRFLTYLPLSHVLGRLESFFPILFGSETVYARDMKKLILDIPLVKPSLLVAVPRVLEKIYEKAMKELSKNELKKSVFNWAMNAGNNYFETINSDKTPKTSTLLQYQLAKKIVFEKIYQMFGGNIRYFISGGAPLSTKIIEFLRNSNLTVLEGYGLTETIAPCFINPMNKQIPGTVGQPMGDVEVKFLEDGEILLRSKALFSGYYKNDIETQKAITKDGWFKTGDIGEFNSQGFLKITDRKKDIIITSGGKNVSPQKIENALKLSPYIAQSAVVGEQKKYLSALIAIEKESFIPLLEKFEIPEDCNHETLANHPKINELIQQEIDTMNHELASYESIKYFRILPCEITTDNYLTPSLKIKRKLINKNFKSLIEAMYK